jgi:hypothetical protein
MIILFTIYNVQRCVRDTTVFASKWLTCSKKWLLDPAVRRTAVSSHVPINEADISLWIS